MSTSTTSASAAHPPKENVKDTLISVIIAFVLAFVFRGFVIEAFVIPTGSMAPTLLGQHMRFAVDGSGVPWTVGPWHYYPGSPDPKPIQGQAPDNPVAVHDPRTGQAAETRDLPRLAGDRILVLKYLYALNEPRRFDVVVFKNPGDPTVNYIKRLVGLPGEQVALVDGDVFTRIPPRADPTGATPTTWEEPGWAIARKPDDAARAVWQGVFDSAFTPASAKGPDGLTWFSPPWVGAVATGAAGPDWQIDNRRSYLYTGTAPATLTWDSSRTFLTRIGPPGPGSPGPNLERWEINDRYAYNETPLMFGNQNFPVSDIRLKLGLEPGPSNTTLTASPLIEARGHQFRALITPPTASVQMRPVNGADISDAPWTTLDAGPCPALAPGAVANIEFWHMDQRLELRINGALIAAGNYDWTPAQRIAFATGRTLAQLAAQNRSAAMELSQPGIYRAPKVSWSFSGGPFTLHRVALDRDLHYRADRRRTSNQPAWATHPSTTPRLTSNQFFVCGDNSPASEDSRLWERPDDWVAAQIDPTTGVVPRELMLGKAFFVYFPALAGSSPIPMPDFGRLRWIR